MNPVTPMTWLYDLRYRELDGEWRVVCGLCCEVIHTLAEDDDAHSVTQAMWAHECQPSDDPDDYYDLDDPGSRPPGRVGRP